MTPWFFSAGYSYLVTDFNFAKSMLYGPRSKLRLSSQAIESVCLACSREFYDNASSGNYKTGDMKLAYEWYVSCSFKLYG